MRKLQWIKLLFRNPICGRIRRLFFHLFNLFYLPNFYSFCQSKLKNTPKETQIFLMTRGDFGTILVLLNYIYCWEEQRGKTCLVVLTHHFAAVSQLAKAISPKTQLICPGRIVDYVAKFFFGSMRVHFHTFARVYARLVIDYPNALYLFPQPSTPRMKADYSPYIPFFDQALRQIDSRTPTDFVQAYKETRYVLDYRQDLYLDMIDLHYNRDLSKPRSFLPEKLKTLKKNLSINGSYVVMNINCKDNPLSHNRKKTAAHQDFNVLIDYLIERGHYIVIQGRKEQPFLEKRRGLINYAKSAYCSAENDLLLYSGCLFAIVTKSGPENFGTLCNIPLLGLNYVELPAMQPNLKMRFFPKQIRDLKSGRYFSWRELLKAPFYFDVGANKFNEQIEYLDMETDELMIALEEFLPLLSHSPEQWLDLTPLQTAFRKELTPLHLDLYNIKGVPCNSYLASPKFN